MHMPQDEQNQNELQNNATLETQVPPSEIAPNPVVVTQNPTPPQSIDPFVRETLRELHLETQRLTAENARLQAQKQEEKVDFNSFVADPNKVMADAIERQIAPMKEMFSEFARKQQYDSIKAQFAADPTYGPALKQFESQIDQFMQGNAPTAANFQAAIYAAVAQAQFSGQAYNPNPTPPAPVQQENRQPMSNVPPQARPSAPAAPVAQSPNATRQPTEKERHVMTMMGFNPNDPKSLKEYFDYLEAPSNVGSWSGIGK
jgi:hypothetical protein